MHMEAALREVLRDKRGLHVFYQPIVSIQTGEVVAREALVRWQHPERGWIEPAEFIPVAEQSGLIDELSQYVCETACRDAAGWDDDCLVAVNISATQLGRDKLAQPLQAALTASGLAPNRLEIEITETALLDDARDVIGDLQQVRALGVRVALDDFGTGFSSLSHLRLFPFDKIKIDGSFVREAVIRPDCTAIVRAVAELGRQLGAATVAEGVETPSQLNCVWGAGCTEVQGFLVGMPMPNEQTILRKAEIPRLKDLITGHAGE
jgi:predicted signal transduction protein with EAL and GGDEF domain